MNLQENIRRILREETNHSKPLHNLLNLLFEGFDDIYYDWAEYNCGMGVCCDPYAIGFTLPKSDYDDYLFKLVVDGKWEPNGDNYPDEISDELPEVCYEQPNIKDPNFDTIVFYDVFVEEIENYMGSKNNWGSDLLNIINQMFGCNANRIIII